MSNKKMIVANDSLIEGSPVLTYFDSFLDSFDLDEYPKKFNTEENRRICRLIAGLVHVFQPARHECLQQAIVSSGYSKNLAEGFPMILACAPKSWPVITNTGNYYIENNKDLCKQAALEVEGELIKLMEE